VTEAVDWEVAARIAGRIGGREPFAESYHYASLLPDFEELTAEAEDLVAAETGLRSLSGPARARVTDRAGWVQANIASFQRLIRPVTDRLAHTHALSSSPIAPVARRIAGAEVGTLLGWMSTRVLGQYDLLLVEDDRPEDQDIVYYVGPNVLSLEKRFAFPPREFRLWLALHEVTHRVQFTGIEWMRPHFLSLVEHSLQAIDPDPRRFLEAMRRAVDQMRRGHNPLDDGGVVAMLAGADQYAVLQQVQGLMSLLEGHGDITMDRAGADRIPSAERFSRVLRERRQNQPGPMKLVQKLIGLEAKLKQYERGERFIEAVEAEGGSKLFERVWQGPEWLPSADEIRSPALWIERARSATPVPG
jgi:coenzyme F420 biosynthesis associated uncharacterized protein